MLIMSSGHSNRRVLKVYHFTNPIFRLKHQIENLEEKLRDAEKENQNPHQLAARLENNPQNIVEDQSMSKSDLELRVQELTNKNRELMEELF